MLQTFLRRSNTYTLLFCLHFVLLGYQVLQYFCNTRHYYAILDTLAKTIWLMKHTGLLVLFFCSSTVPSLFTLTVLVNSNVLALFSCKAEVPEFNYIACRSVLLSSYTCSEMMHNLSAHQLPQYYQLQYSNFYGLNCFGHIYIHPANWLFQNISKHLIHLCTNSIGKYITCHVDDWIYQIRFFHDVNLLWNMTWIFCKFFFFFFFFFFFNEVVKTQTLFCFYLYFLFHFIYFCYYATWSAEERLWCWSYEECD